MFDLWRAIVLGIIEGITEFLPVSSTGHLIVASDLLRFQRNIGGTFEIFIQLGAVLAVVWFYFRDLMTQVRTVAREQAVQRFWLNLLIAFLPAAIIGLLIHDWIKAVLFTPPVVAVTLALGGIILIVIEGRDHSQGTTSLYEMTPRQALGIGLAQVFSLVPGVSRSGASIVGGLLGGLDRPTATAFSFYLAIPTLGSATVFDLLTSLDQVQSGDVLPLAVGTLVSFLVAFLAVGWLLRYVARHSFRAFGTYRIIVGLAVLSWWLWLA